jgi:hypothetical protein
VVVPDSDSVVEPAIVVGRVLPSPGVPGVPPELVCTVAVDSVTLITVVVAVSHEPKETFDRGMTLEDSSKASVQAVISKITHDGD